MAGDLRSLLKVRGVARGPADALARQGATLVPYGDVPTPTGRRLFPTACGSVTPIASPSVTARS